jgi:hypothetical protein
VARFDFLKKQLDVAENTAVFCIEGTDIDVLVSHAGKSNKPYWAESMRLSKKLDRLALTYSKLPDRKKREGALELNDEFLRLTRKLFPVFIIKGWSGVTNEDGEEVPYQAEAAAEFMDALPDDIVESMREFAGDVANFYDPMDVEATAKNSERGSNGNSDTSETDSQSKPR